MVVLAVRYFREKGEERFDSDGSEILYDERLYEHVSVLAALYTFSRLLWPL